MTALCVGSIGVLTEFAPQQPGFEHGNAFSVGLALVAAASLLWRRRHPVVDSRDPDFDSWGDVVVGVVIFTSAWVWGDSRRLRREQLEMVQERAERERARDADREERARLAREMHDIVAHSVRVMVVQAGGRPPDGRARPERRRRGRRPGRDDGARRPARDAPGARRAAGRGRRAA